MAATVTQHDKKVQLMRRAIELSAIGAREGGAPFGCVVVKDGEIVGEGHNVVVRTCDPTAHGEVVAIRSACKKLNTWNLAGCEIYTSCEPCAMCTSVIWLCRIDKMYYANSFHDTLKYCSMGGMTEDVSSHVEKRSVPAERLCAEEARHVIASWGEQMGDRIDPRLGVSASDEIKQSTTCDQVV